MTELNPLAEITGPETNHKQPKRGWNCPSASAVAAYVDCALGDTDRTRLQRHLAGCGYCRTLVVDIIKLQGAADLPEAPTALIERVRALGPSASERRSWNWVAVTTAGTLACAAIAMMILEKPQTLSIPGWPAPAVPVISKSEPAASPGPSRSGPVRNLKSLESVPTITFPPADKVIARKRLEFRWKEVPDSLYYEVRVLTSEGDLIWEGDSSKTDVKLPTDLPLAAGKCFVLVSAVMKNGHLRESNPVAFQVASSQ
jgi:hypothetical protein